jgi:hypothetical protein
MLCYDMHGTAWYGMVWYSMTLMWIVSAELWFSMNSLFYFIHKIESTCCFMLIRSCKWSKIIPMCLSICKILCGWNLNCKIQYIGVAILAGPMRRSYWIYWTWIWWYVPWHWIVRHSDQHKSSTICMRITPRLGLIIMWTWYPIFFIIIDPLF